MLRQAFRDAVVTLRHWLNNLQGQVVAFGYAQREPYSAMKGKYDGRGAYLIEEITRMLQPATTGLVWQQQFIVMQLIA